MNIHGPVSYKKITIFWFPLFLTWLMMAVEGPYIAAIIARLPHEKYNLAAFGVSFSFALVIEAPVIMLMSATIALVKDRSSFLKVRRFTIFLNTAAVLINLLFLVPGVFHFITYDLIGLDAEISRRVYVTSFALLPWAPAIGYRRFYQGLLIKHHQTGKVTQGTIFRLTAMGITAALLARYVDLEGSVIGGIALCTGVTAEALATRFLVNMTRNKVLQKVDKVYTSGKEYILCYRRIIVFYWPLALTTLIALSVRPAIVFFLGKSRMSLETLAVLPVINSLLFIFAAIGLSMQEVIVALMGDHQQNRIKLEKFALTMALSVTVLYGLITFSPLATVWFHTVSGLSMELTLFSILPARILFGMPFMSVFLSFVRGSFVHLNKTKFISNASGIEVAGILIALSITVAHLDLVGAVAASISITCGRFTALMYLFWKLLRHNTVTGQSNRVRDGA